MSQPKSARKKEVRYEKKKKQEPARLTRNKAATRHCGCKIDTISKP